MLEERIREILRKDLRALAFTLQQADLALQELELGKRKWSEEPPAPPPAKGKEEPRSRRTRYRGTAGVQKVWNQLEPALEAHIARESDHVLPMLAEIAAGNRDLKPKMRGPINQMLVEHTDLLQLVRSLRNEIRDADPIRHEMNTLCKRIEEHVRDIEGEVFPGALGELTEETDLIMDLRNAHTTPDDIVKALRERAGEQAIEVEAPRGVMAKLWRYLRPRR